MLENKTQSEIINLSADDEGQVCVSPNDYDAFYMTQREAVDALQKTHQIMTLVDILRQRFDAFNKDIVAWGTTHKVNAIVFGQRPDEGFFVVIAPDEDEDNKLQDQLYWFEIEMEEKYDFRLSFMMLRASEADGLGSFVNIKKAKVIVGAPLSGSSN